MCSPCDPTVGDVLLHKVNHHLPYRNWCPQCVAAKGKERDHKQANPEDIAAEEHALTQYGLDYAFFSEEPEYELIRIDEDEKKAKEEQVVIKVAAMKEKKTGNRFAHMAPVKGGSDEYVAEAIADDIETMGGTEVILKTDQEPAMVDLAKEIHVIRKLKTVLENSPVGDSQSKGLAEKRNTRKRGPAEGDKV